MDTPKDQPFLPVTPPEPATGEPPNCALSPGWADWPSAENPFLIILVEDPYIRHGYASAEWIEAARWEHERYGLAQYNHEQWTWSDAGGPIGSFRFVRVWPNVKDEPRGANHH